MFCFGVAVRPKVPIMAITESETFYISGPFWLGLVEVEDPDYLMDEIIHLYIENNPDAESLISWNKPEWDIRTIDLTSAMRLTPYWRPYR